MDSFYNADKVALLETLSAKDIIDSLTLIDVKNFLESLGVDQIEVNIEKQILICPTICHNPLHETASMKLYWYQNNKIFHCYTECNEAMTIFQLYQKYMALNYYNVTLAEAEDYVKQFLQHIIIAPKITNAFQENTEKYQFSTVLPTLPEYPRVALDCFTHYYHPTWLREGITTDVMDKFQVRFSLAQNKIIIPHFDLQGRLIGIRGRTLNPEEAELYGKYRPVQVGSILYTHPLQFNLYGVYEHQQAIRKRRCAIIAEAEKSVMLDDSYYGSLSNCVACCGSSFNKYQISLLTDYLGANEIVIALDKEYTDWRTEKAKHYQKKIQTMCEKYKNQATFSYIWDYDNVLEEKDSPFDKGREVFEHLFKTRIRIR